MYLDRDEKYVTFRICNKGFPIYFFKDMPVSSNLNSYMLFETREYISLFKNTLVKIYFVTFTFYFPLPEN